MKTKAYQYQGRQALPNSAKAARMKRLCRISLPVPETTEELARLFRRVPVEKYARLCVAAAKISGGDVSKMATWLYAATLFPRLRARRERQEAARKAKLAKGDQWDRMDLRIEQEYDDKPAGQRLLDFSITYPPVR